MDLNKYQVNFDITYEKVAGQSRSTSGYEIVYAGSPDSSKLVAKARALQSLKKQGCKLIMLNIKDSILLEAAQEDK